MKLIDKYFKGLLYKSEIVYTLAALYKFGFKQHERFNLAVQNIEPGESVLELCPAYGKLIHYLPENCSYRCIDASPHFIKALKARKINCLNMDLRKGLDHVEKVDVIVIIDSLCHFRETSVDCLLENFKSIAKKIIIIECLERKDRSRGTLMRRLVYYLTAMSYYLPVDMFYYSEFESLLDKHNYQCRRYNDVFAVGLYGV